LTGKSVRFTENNFKLPGAAMIKNSKDLSRELLSQQAFLWAQALVPLVEQQSSEESKALIFGAICIYYARPFTSNRGFGMISDDIVPCELQDVHDALITQRNKVTAHSDLSDEVNRIYLCLNEEKGISIEFQFKAPTQTHLEKVKLLLQAVIQATKTRVIACLDAGGYAKELTTAGDYRFMVTESQVWLEKAPANNPEFRGQLSK